jgi:hypothetical protein
MMGLLLAFVLGVGYPGLPQGAPASDPTEALKNAKALFFDHKYVEARAAWQRAQAAAPEEALYWIARCSDALGESERAFTEYGAFLDRNPSDPLKKEEAKTGRIAIASKLYKGGQARYLSLLTDGLVDPSKTVRYFTAFQVARVPGAVGQKALPILREILGKESDPDLVDRARILVMGLDPKALSGEPAPPGKKATWLRVRITKKGKTNPEVAVNVPVALAELLFKSLPDDAKTELRKKGYDADNFWERLKSLGPTTVVHIEGEDGEQIDIYLE